MHILPFIAALASVTSAQVQPTPPPSTGEIVVEGKRQAIESTLKDMLRPTDQGQLARFEAGICPRVFGFPADWTATLTRTIRDNIVAAGGRVLPKGCGPNALVIFIYEPQALVKGLAERMPDLFENAAVATRLAARVRPVTSWHVTDMKSRDGVPLEKVNRIDVNGMGMPADAYVVRNAGVSRLYSNVREDMRMGIVVVDAERTHGLSLRQLADLATMHLLLDVRTDAGAHPSDSILSIFDNRADGSPPPKAMSRTDRAVLAGFYGLDRNNYSASQQRRKIAREAARKLSEEER